MSIKNPPLIPVDDFYHVLERELGRPPKYFQRIELPNEDLEFLYIFVSFQMEIHQATKTVGEMFGIRSFSAIRKHCLITGFKFDQMIKDQVLAGIPQSELKSKHGIGHKRISNILAEHDAVPKRGFHREDVTKEDVRPVHRQNNSIRKTTQQLGASRTTIIRRLKD